jgi:hypothetical protein
MLAWQYNTVGVSDGITMGGEGLLLWSVHFACLYHAYYVQACDSPCKHER